MINSYVKILATVVGNEEEANSRFAQLHTPGLVLWFLRNSYIKLKTYQVFCGFCPTLILMFPTKTMEVCVD